MKQLLIDYYRRWWWVVVVVGIMHVFMGWLTFQSDQVTFFFPSALFLGVLPFSWDLLRGQTRALLSMPVSSRELARAWWWTGVGLPALFLAFASLLAYGLAGGHAKVSVVVLSTLLSTLLPGSAFFALTQFPNRPPTTIWQHIQSAFFGAIFGVSIGGAVWFLKEVAWGTTKTNIVLLTGTAMTVASWWGAGNLLKHRGELRAASQNASSQKRGYWVGAGSGGISFLVQTCVVRVVGLAVFFLAITSGIGLLLSRGAGLSLQDIASLLLAMLSLYSSFGILLVCSLPLLLHVRFLRTLPISSKGLATVLVAVPAGAMLTVGAITTLFAYCVMGADSHGLFSNFLVAVGFASLCIPFLLWRGQSMLTFGFVTGIGGGAATLVMYVKNLPSALTLTLALGLTLLAWQQTYRLLQRGSEAYRVRPFPFANWGLNR